MPANLINFGAIAAICFMLGCSSSPSLAQKPSPLVTAADLARIQGSPKAKTWVIVVSDYQCPYCKVWHDEVYTQIHKELIIPGKIRLAYLNFPLRMHEHAMPAAEAAMCAASQNRFWEMQKAIFANQEKWSEMTSVSAHFDSLAQKAGVKNMAQWRGCVKDGTMKGLIQSDYDRGVKAGVRGTPTIIVGDKILPESSIEEIRKAVNGTPSGK